MSREGLQRKRMWAADTGMIVLLKLCICLDISNIQNMFRLVADTPAEGTWVQVPV